MHPANNIRVLHRSQSDILNPFSYKAINNHRKAYLKEMKKEEILMIKEKWLFATNSFI
jgi:hypothetical protein